MTGDRLKSAVFFVGIMLLGIATAVVLYFYQNLYHSNSFLPGVHIDGLSVAGISRQEAVVKLDEHIKSIGNTEVVFKNGDYIYIKKLSEICRPMKSEEIIDNVWYQDRKRSIKSKIFNLDGSRAINYPIKVSYDSMVLNEIGQEFNNKLSAECVNASLEVDSKKGLIIKPSRNGKSVDIKATFNQLPQDTTELGSTGTVIPIIIQDEYPVITADDLELMGELAAYTTWYNTKEIDRSNNLCVAAQAVNGSVITPGKIFSFNKIVGERSSEAGYRNALVIMGNKFEPGMGGGICQVSSTLYNAVLLAGLEIVERHNHTLAVAYVPLGLDATVAYGLQDFKFKNNTDYPIYIRAVAGAGKVTVNIYGHLDYKKNIKLSHVIDKVIDFSEVREVDENLKPGEEKVDHKGIPGYIVRSFASYYDSKGELVSTRMLARDIYNPLNKLIYVGPENNSSDSVKDNNMDNQDTISTEDNIDNDTEQLPDESAGDNSNEQTNETSEIIEN